MSENYKWTPDLFRRYARKHKLKLTKASYLRFHKSLMRAQSKGKLELAKAGHKFRPKTKIFKDIEKWQKELLREKKIKHVAWMYLRVRK